VTISRVLIANRGEIAIRIAEAAASLGIESVSIHPPADASSLHTTATDTSVALSNGDGVEAYLDIEAVIGAAKRSGCDAVHPGYGFLSENAVFAKRCADEGLLFIGPSADALALFGDKVRARQLAESLTIPTVPGSAPLSSTVDAAAAAELVGYPVMLKASAGGGGRGMRRVDAAADLAEAFERCQSEALASFGNDAVFLERLVERPRHIEVQVLADGSGRTVHLFDRDCSVQLRNQKVVEVAPATGLADDLRQKMLSEAVLLVEAASYENAGTVEFLVQPETGEHFFIECNPRIQVEHTITEEVMGIDLVASQFRISAGETLADLGFGTQGDVGEPVGCAVQARVVATGMGTLDAYAEPSGPGVRVDGSGYSGLTPSPLFDPLLAKVICSNRSADVAAAVDRTRRALENFHISGLPTNLGQLSAILGHDDVRSGDARTTLLAEAPHLISAIAPSSARLALLGTRVVADNSIGDSSSSLPMLAVGEDDTALPSPLGATILEIRVAVGDAVNAGDIVIVLNAMKMETTIIAPHAGTVTEMQILEIGDVVAPGDVLVVLAPGGAGSATSAKSVDPADTWGPLLDEVASLQALAHARLAPGSDDPGVVRQRNRGKLTCRERIDELLDPDSFREVGSLAGFASYDEYGGVADFTPANMVGGQGRIDRRRVILCADDFTSRGGHADGAIGAKSLYLDRLSIELGVPAIRLLDGSSGGGSVAAMVPEQKKEGDSTAKESTGAIKAGRPRVAGGGGSFLPGHLGSSAYTRQLSTVPVVNMLLGSVVGIGAAKAVLGHFSVMVRDISQLFVAGPPVVSHAMGYEVTKEDLGDWRIHCVNGSVDNLAETEQEAAMMTRRFLSYLPSSVHEAPPVLAPNLSDPPDRRDEELFTLVPRKRTTTFDMRRAIELMADVGSFFEVGPLWGTDQITGFVRFNGHPLGVIASDSRHVNGGALTADGCDKLTRHLDLCDLFHIPVLNLVDNPGFAVGIEHEKRSTIRKGAEWMVAFAQINVPIFTVLMRRSFGVAGNNYATPQSQPMSRVIWPAADVGGIPPEGGIEAAYKRQLAESDDPVALRAELNARIEAARGPIGPLNRFQMEEMIDPRDTRAHICDWVDTAYNVVRQPSRLVPRALGYRP
jgi:acetyl/propionyl-CoA carboxylase alpha subunit/acetyl-CoA carboxylase carboxyltransferase component